MRTKVKTSLRSRAGRYLLSALLVSAAFGWGCAPAPRPLAQHPRAAEFDLEDPAVAAAFRFFVGIDEADTPAILKRGRQLKSRNAVSVVTSRDAKGFSDITVDLDTFAVVFLRTGNPISMGYDPKKPNLIKTEADLLRRAAELHAWNNTGEAKWGPVGKVRFDTFAPSQEEVKIENGMIRGPVKRGPRGRLYYGITELDGVPVWDNTTANTYIEICLNTGLVAVWNGHGAYEVVRREWGSTEAQAREIAENYKWEAWRDGVTTSRGPVTSLRKMWIAENYRARPARLIPGYVAQFTENVWLEIDAETGQVRYAGDDMSLDDAPR